MTTQDHDDTRGPGGNGGDDLIERLWNERKEEPTMTREQIASACDPAWVARPGPSSCTSGCTWRCC